MKHGLGILGVLVKLIQVFQDNWATVWDFGYALTPILEQFWQNLGCN